jgi:protein gp37
MAKNNPGDVLTCNWNPVIGCRRYSEGCRSCWYLDGVVWGEFPAGFKK